MVKQSKKKIYHSIQEIPKYKVGLVLGTSKYIKNSYHNPYFDNRITAAAQLYHTGKVKHLILSGDNRYHNYDEPSAMQTDLLNLGVPEKAMTLDYAGFRTLDSIVRCSEVFGQQKFVIISQEFHNQRALFLAEQYGLEAVAFNAKTPLMTKKMEIREYLAKAKAVLDVFVLHKKPKFLGKKIEITFD